MSNTPEAVRRESTGLPGNSLFTLDSTAAFAPDNVYMSVAGHFTALLSFCMKITGFKEDRFSSEAEA